MSQGSLVSLCKHYHPHCFHCHYYCQDHICQSKFLNKMKTYSPNIRFNQSSNVFRFTGNKKFKSPKPFQSNRINTCSFVKSQGNITKAMPFYVKQKQQKIVPSLYHTSWSQQVHQNFTPNNAGMIKKQLVKYDPNANRNRLLQAGDKLQVSNCSQICLGQSYQKQDKRAFMTTYKNFYRKYKQEYPTKNIGIETFKTIYFHKQQQK